MDLSPIPCKICNGTMTPSDERVFICGCGFEVPMTSLTDLVVIYEERYESDREDT